MENKNIKRLIIAGYILSLTGLIGLTIGLYLTISAKYDKKIKIHGIVISLIGFSMSVILKNIIKPGF
ncbi:MAG: hypothetical protein Q8880_01635 [Bacteroidota bacterium]|nr:hypothetical protein [Bacteroidota bacterium]